MPVRTYFSSLNINVLAISITYPSRHQVTSVVNFHGCLSIEALQVASVGRQLGLQDLNGNDSIDQMVNSLVNGALSAGGYVLQDLVSTYPLLTHSKFTY